MHIFSFRNLGGALLFLLFVGEPTVGAATGLYTPQGFPVLFSMYFLLFLLYEALAEKYSLTYGRLALLNFGIYSVIITSLLHGEIADYVLNPKNSLITTLIRVQCSFFPLFAYYLLNRWTRRKAEHLPKLRNILIACGLYVLALTPTGTFGLTKLASTFKVIPGLAILLSILGVGAIILSLKPHLLIRTPYKNALLSKLTWVLLALGTIPTIATFMGLVVLMPIVAITYLIKPSFRNTTI